MEGRLLDWQRLSDLRHRETDHTWLWSFNPAHGPCLDSEEMAAAVRSRLGADQVEQAVVCTRCGKEPLLGPCAHALCCAGAGETEEHNRAQDSAHALARSSLTLPPASSRKDSARHAHGRALPSASRMPPALLVAAQPWTLEWCAPMRAEPVRMPVPL